ncbi:18647_t:CDS:2, partial [Racocetra fulgida]
MDIPTTQISEYNVEDCINDHEANLDGLLDHFDQFVERLHNPIINTNYLPIGAILIERNENSSSKTTKGVEYIVPTNTDFHEWVNQFGKATGATYVKHDTEQNIGNNVKPSHHQSQERQQHQQYSVEELRYNIQKMTQDLEDLDLNRLQIVHDQISWILEDVRKPDRSFQPGNWVDENQKMKLPPHMHIEKQK